MKTKLMLVLLAAVMVAAVGCGKKYPKAGSPKQAVLNMRQALLDGNEKGFINCIDADDNERRGLGAIFQAIQASKNFEEKVTAAYGAEVAEGMSDAEDSPFAALEDIKPEDIEVKEDGDNATAELPGESEPLKLIRKDGVWLITMGRDKPSKEEVDQMVSMMGKLTEVMNEYADKAGQGLSAEEFAQEMDAAMTEARMGGPE